MKKLLALALVLCMIFALAVSGAAYADDAVSITLWTYPIGGWGNSDTVDQLIAAFEAANPGIKVSVEYLAYADGDDKVNTAIEGKAAPDLIMEGPERLVANWGAKGYMVDLADLWTDTAKAEILPVVQAACFNKAGASYEYPLCMTAHCMAINLNRFQAVGADKLVDLDALINNLYSGTFTDADHTKYTADSEENIKALELLAGLEGVNFDPAIVGGDEINLFRQGILDMAFCWNIGAQLNTDNNDAGLTNDGDQIVCMAFPSDDGVPELCGGIWGFGIFDNGSADKIEAAKTFIKYMADSPATADAVKASTYFAVRDTAEGADLTKIYDGNDIMSEYTKLMPFLGDYYQVVPGWAEARTAWWNMLQQVGSGADVTAAVAEFCATANAAAAK